MIAVQILFVVVCVAIIIIFYIVCWDFIAAQPPNIGRVWAIVATTLLPFMAMAGAVIGLWFGLKRSEWVLEGIEKAGGTLAPLFGKFGVEAADVRVYAGRGLGMLRRESRNSQELFLPPGAIEIVQPERSERVVEV